MAATRKAPWTIYAVAFLVQDLSIATSMSVRQHIHDGDIHQDNASLTGAHARDSTPAFSYSGCGSALDALGRAFSWYWSCTQDADVFYVNCGRILHGDIDTKATQCAERCSALPQYVAFSVHDQSACMCMKTSPQLADVSTPASSCSQPANDVVFGFPQAGGAGGGAAAVGDPHLQNVHGERFDLMKPGKHILINIPRGKSAEHALLRVQADARRLGGQCADMYFQELNVTGSWAEAKQAGGYHYTVSQRDVEAPGWVAFGKVGLKVAHGRTASGLSYLNLYVKHLGRAGYAVGGLLGEDDHEDIITPPAECGSKMSLIGLGAGDVL